MFSYRFPSDKDSETTIVILELIYPMMFHLISLSMGLGMKEW